MDTQTRNQTLTLAGFGTNGGYEPSLETHPVLDWLAVDPRPGAARAAGSVLEVLMRKLSDTHSRPARDALGVTALRAVTEGWADGITWQELHDIEVVDGHAGCGEDCFTHGTRWPHVGRAVSHARTLVPLLTARPGRVDQFEWVYGEQEWAGLADWYCACTTPKEVDAVSRALAGSLNNGTYTLLAEVRRRSGVAAG